MRNITQVKLKYLSFYYFWLIFFVACIAFDFYMGILTGFTFGYMAAFVYMFIRLKSVEKQLENYHDE